MGFLFGVKMHMGLYYDTFLLLKMRFSCGVNVYEFITMVLFLWLKIGINCQNRYTRE